jgi:menaquinone-dependent protoporphyrinogen oxidase
MKVLVAYASRHGATTGIAERVGQVLSSHGLDVMVRPVADAEPLGGYDAFVVGSAAYMGRWLKDARQFVQHHEAELTAHPTWLFSSGPIGAETVDKHGRDVREASRPVEFGELASEIRPRGTAVFFGAFDPEAEPIGAWERLGAPFLRMPAVRKSMPAGDFRDWPAIEAWAGEIAEALTTVAAPA